MVVDLIKIKIKIKTNIYLTIFIAKNKFLSKRTSKINTTRNEFKNEDFGKLAESKSNKKPGLKLDSKQVILPVK